MITGRFVIIQCLATAAFLLSGTHMLEAQQKASLKFPSVFEERLLKSNGSIPKPFSVLMNTLKTSPNDFPDTVLVSGRSLQAKDSTFEFPRKIVVFLEDNQPVLFIGYAPLSKKLEVISWNRYFHKYQFMEVQNYAPDSKDKDGKSTAVSPSLAKNVQNICQTCHQNAAGIFTRFPWNETTGNPDLVEKFNDGLKAAQKDNLELSDFAQQSQTGTNLPFNYDGRVRTSNQLAQASKVCSVACGNNIECKKQVLYMALLNTRLVGNSQTFRTEGAKFAELARNTWPQDNFGYNSSVLPDRNPLIESKNGGLSIFFIPKNMQELAASLNGRNPSFATGLNSSVGLTGINGKGEPASFEIRDGKLNEIITAQTDDTHYLQDSIHITYHENLSISPSSALQGISEMGIIGTQPLRDENGVVLNPADPKTPRPKVSQISPNLAAALIATVGGFACYNMSQKQIESLAAFSSEKIHRLIFETTLFNNGLSDNSLNGNKIVSIFEKNKNLVSDPSNCVACEIRKIMPQASQSQMDIRATTTSDTSPTQVVQKYCATCHTGQGVPRPLPLNAQAGRLSRLANYRPRNGGSVADYVAGTNGKPQMPPGIAPQPSSNERAALLDHLKSLAQ